MIRYSGVAQSRCAVVGLLHRCGDTRPGGRGPRLPVWTVEALVQVAPEVKEVDLVSGPGRLEFGAQLAEIAPAVNERLD
jgi:hypothetical protein